MEIDSSFSATTPVRQGDLIAKSNSSQRHPFDQFGVIITADCDLERARPEHQITFLRVVPIAEYVNYVWCRKKIHDALRKLRADASSMFNRLSHLADASRTPITSEKLVEWLMASSVNEVCSTLEGVDAHEKIAISKKLDHLVNAITKTSVDFRSPALEPLISLRVIERNVASQVAQAEIIKQAKSELSKESDEVFFLSQLVTDEETDGYYVLLDNVSTVRRDQLFDYKSEADKIGDGAHRFGRLEMAFKYAIVQRFAFLFQRVGLPDERIELHRGALQRVGEE